MKPWLAVLAVLSFSSFAYSSGGKVEALNRKLELSRAGWTARETEISKMTMAEWKALLGGPGNQTREVEFSAADSENLHSYTSSGAAFDWRNRNGVNWVSPILNQGACGSCVAFASIGTLETQMKIESSFSNYQVKLSPQFLFSCGGGSCQNGWTPQSAAQFLQKYGVPDDSCMPYSSGQGGQDVSCKLACNTYPERSVRISSFTRPTRSVRNIEAIKRALLKGPLVTTMDVYSDFMHYGTGIYKHVSITIRNSWGPQWGEHGFARISYDDISGVGNSTWQFQVQVAAPHLVNVTEPVQNAYYSQVLPVKITSAPAGTQAVVAVIYDSNGVAINTEDVPSSGRLALGDLADGNYEIEMHAVDARGATLGDSGRRKFHLATALMKNAKGFPLRLKKKISSAVIATNQADQASLSRSGGLGFEIEALQLKGAIEKVEFHARHLGSGEESVRTAEAVESGTQLNWHTAVVKNGQYEVWVVGRIKAHTPIGTQEIVSASDHHLVTVKNNEL
jgi:hypothetical protein